MAGWGSELSTRAPRQPAGLSRAELGPGSLQRVMLPDIPAKRVRPKGGPQCKSRCKSGLALSLGLSLTQFPCRVFFQ